MQKRFGKRPLGFVMAAVMAAQLCACGNAQKSDLQETEVSNIPAQETSNAVDNAFVVDNTSGGEQTVATISSSTPVAERRHRASGSSSPQSARVLVATHILSLSLFSFTTHKDIKQ